jgi:hypothetical protein
MDAFFLDYDEPKSDENYQTVKKIIPFAQRIITKSGISDSHKLCAQKSFTDKFMVIDADNELLDFNFSEIADVLSVKEKVFIFRSLNPVNDLEYGHGGVKIFDRNLFHNNDTVDFSTSFIGNIKIVYKTLSIHRFNSTPFHTFRTAFRECVKLSSEIIPNSNSKQNEERLNIWCSKFNNVENVEYAQHGALAGRDFGNRNKNDINELKKINNFSWLNEQYEKLVR